MMLPPQTGWYLDMMWALWLFLLSVLIGQMAVRFSCKAYHYVGRPVLWVSKLGASVALFLYGGVDGGNWLEQQQEQQEPTSLQDLLSEVMWLRILLITLGLWVGEAFCPIALTGSIATGKSTVAHMLLTTQSPNKRHGGGVYMIDSDSIGHEILLPSRVLSQKGNEDSKENNKQHSYTVTPTESVYETICTVFAKDRHNFLDPDSGLIVRRKLGAVIFANNQKRKALNRITHPTIIRILVHRIFYGIYVQRASLCCADVPLLFESGGLRYLFCMAIVVATNPDIQYTRLRQRNPDLSQEECRNRIKSQYPMDRKVAAADIVIWNNGSVKQLQQRVQEVQQEIQDRLKGGISMSAMFLLTSVSAILVSLYPS